MLRSAFLKPDSVVGQSRLELDAAPAVDVLQLLARWTAARRTRGRAYRGWAQLGQALFLAHGDVAKLFEALNVDAVITCGDGRISDIR